MSKVRIKSLVSGRIGIVDNNTRIRRDWDKKGAIRLIDMEDLEQLVYDPGVEYMFKQGMLGIDEPNSKELLIALGLEEEGVPETEIVTLTEEEMKDLMTSKSISFFRKKVKQLPKEQLTELVNFCIKNELTNYEKVMILKELTKVDILNAIRINKEDKEGREKQN